VWGIEDPRITYVEELGKYAVAYTAFSRGGPGVALALTKDFRDFERYGLVMQPDDKDAALLPRRINGKFALLHRPATPSSADVWISFSPDLRNWGGHRRVLQARMGGWWDANRVGLSPPLIETPRGWLKGPVTPMTMASLEPPPPQAARGRRRASVASARPRTAMDFLGRTSSGVRNATNRRSGTQAPRCVSPVTSLECAL
jgi:hypothetical protein